MTTLLDSVHHPFAVVRIHTIFKGLQIGAASGIVLGIPFVLLRRKQYYAQSFVFAWSGVVSKSAFLGVCGAFIMYFFKSRDMVLIEWVDSAIRIQENASQKSLDLYCVVGGALGMMAALPTVLFGVSDIAPQRMIHRLVPRLFRGLATGMGLGTLAFCVTRLTSTK